MSDVFAALARVVVNGVFSRLAVYTPEGGEAKAVRVVLVNQQVEAESKARGEYCEIKVCLEDVPSPEINDQFEVNGEIWKASASTDQQIQRKLDGGLWTIRCRRSMRPNLAGGR